VTIGMLAERLQIRHHSAVELVDRLVSAAGGPAGATTATADRWLLTLRPAGETVLRGWRFTHSPNCERRRRRLLATLRRLVRDANGRRR